MPQHEVADGWCAGLLAYVVRLSIIAWLFSEFDNSGRAGFVLIDEYWLQGLRNTGYVSQAINTDLTCDWLLATAAVQCLRPPGLPKVLGQRLLAANN